MTMESLCYNIRKRGVAHCISFYTGKLFSTVGTALMNLIGLFYPDGTQTIVFYNGVNNEYADNTRALSDYLLENGMGSKYRIVWCVATPRKYDKIKGIVFAKLNEASGWVSPEALFYCATAKYFMYLYNTGGYHRKYNDKQIVVNLWHGNGYKNVKSNQRHKDYVFDYALVSGDLFVDAKAKYWNCDKQKILPIGYPRYDLLLRSCNKEECFFKLAGVELKGRKLILWMPTFLQNAEMGFPENSILTCYGFSGIENEQEFQML